MIFKSIFKKKYHFLIGEINIKNHTVEKKNNREKTREKNTKPINGMIIEAYEISTNAQICIQTD